MRFLLVLVLLLAACSAPYAIPSQVPPPAAPLPTQDPGEADSAAASEEGWATYCAPTPTHCQNWGGKAMLGAVPSFRWGDTPYQVRVRHGGNDVIVTVVSFCACGNRNGVPTVIDLSPAAFAKLAPLHLGVIRVGVEPVRGVVVRGNPTPPATDR